MIVVQETTSDWTTPVINHIYFLSNSKSKMYAYIHGITGESKVFKNPIDFDPRYRTFELIRRIEEENQGVPVKGSKGDVYFVKNEEGKYSCSCIGVKYHGTCKHIEKIMKECESEKIDIR